MSNQIQAQDRRRSIAAVLSDLATRSSYGAFILLIVVAVCCGRMLRTALSCCARSLRAVSAYRFPSLPQDDRSHVSVLIGVVVIAILIAL